MEKASHGRPVSVKKTATRSSSVNNSKNEYVQGNVVRQLDVKTDILEQPLKKPSKRIQKNREKVFHMSIGYVIFLSAMLFLSAHQCWKLPHPKSELPGHKAVFSQKKSAVSVPGKAWTHAPAPVFHILSAFPG